MPCIPWSRRPRRHTAAARHDNLNAMSTTAPARPLRSRGWAKALVAVARHRRGAGRCWSRCFPGTCCAGRSTATSATRPGATSRSRATWTCRSGAPPGCSWTASSSPTRTGRRNPTSSRPSAPKWPFASSRCCCGARSSCLPCTCPGRNSACSSSRTAAAPGRWAATLPTRRTCRPSARWRWTRAACTTSRATRAPTSGPSSRSIRGQPPAGTAANGRAAMPLRFQAQGRWRDQPFRAEGRTGDVLHLSEPLQQPFPVEVHASTGGTQLRATAAWPAWPAWMVPTWISACRGRTWPSSIGWSG